MCTASQGAHVTTCVVVWIEISLTGNLTLMVWVTTCVVVWIEIRIYELEREESLVTTCVVVWIEIGIIYTHGRSTYGHHLRGGVD